MNPIEEPHTMKELEMATQMVTVYEESLTLLAEHIDMVSSTLLDLKKD